MKKEKPSPSAELVAAIRATESMRPVDEQVCYDPFAKDLTNYQKSLKCLN
jgi:O-methyltransferase involved in polyketide biosynthesis